jgi:hypothetical protein
VTARRALPPREAIERVRALLMEVAATDPEGLLGRGLARFGSWRALAAVLGTDWLPLPRRRAAPLAPLVRRRLRALGAEPAPGLAAELVAAGEPLQLRGTCERLAGLAGDIWRVSVVEDAAGLWAVEEGEDFVLRGAEGDATLVLADEGRLVNASRGGRVRHRRDGARPRRPGRRLRSGRFGPRASLGSVAPVARERDPALRSRRS